MSGYRGIGEADVSRVTTTSVEVLEAADYTQQVPTGQGLANARQVTFGALKTSSNGALRVNADGTIEVLQTGFQHQVDVVLRVGRQSAAGTAELHAWLEVALDGVTFAQPADAATIVHEMDDASTVTRESGTFFMERALPVGAKARVMFARGEGGVNQGTLDVFTPSGTLAGLNASPSAAISIRERQLAQS